MINMYYKFDKTLHNFVKVKWLPTAIKIAIGCAVIFFFLGFNFKFVPKSNYGEQEIMMIMGKYNQFTEEKLIDAIKKKNYKFPYIVFAQAKLETDNFHSKIFLINNNLFGMKEAVNRINTARETQNEHALYDNWRESLEDYGYYYCTYLGKFETEDEYYEYLGQFYAQDPNYVKKVREIVKKENLKTLFAVK